MASDFRFRGGWLWQTRWGWGFAWVALLVAGACRAPNKPESQHGGVAASSTATASTTTTAPEVEAREPAAPTSTVVAAPPAPIGELSPSPPAQAPTPPKLTVPPPAKCGMPDELVARGWQRELAPTSAREPSAVPPGTITIAVLPDTQYYASCASPHFVQQTRWVAAAARTRNIAAVLHLGDITEENTPVEWEYAVASLQPVRQLLPVMLATGNHDYGNEGRADQRFTAFAQYLGSPAAATARYVAETMTPNDVENAYYRMRLPKVTLGVLMLEWSPRTKTVQWANEVLSKYPGDRVIFVTHAYLYHDGTRYDWKTKGTVQEWNPAAYGTGKKNPSEPASAGNVNPNGVYDGQALWDELVSKHSGIFLTLNGHVLSDGVAVLESEADAGNHVQQVLANYQMLNEGGLGYLRLLELLPDGKTLRMKTYSPSLKLFATGPTQNFDLTVQPPLW